MPLLDETQFAFNGLIEAKRAILAALEAINDPEKVPSFPPRVQKKLRNTLANVDFRLNVLVGQPPPKYTLHHIEDKETWRISYLVEGVRYNIMNKSGTNHRFFYSRHKALVHAWEHYEGRQYQDQSLDQI